jgi:hypothetical protein
LRRNSARARRKRRVQLIGVLCLAIGAALLVTSASNSSRPTPPVDVLLKDSRIGGKGGAYYDYLVIQNHSAGNVTVVVVIKTPLDTSERVSAPVTVCGGCKATVEIKEVQPLPDQNLDYYTNAIENPDYVRAEYPPTILTSFALPVGFSAIAIGLILLAYSRTHRR